MVRSKEVPKKPMDPLLTPPSKRRESLRGDNRGGSLPWNRGGASMSPAPATVPNYMRGTSSSDSKNGQRAGVPPSASPTNRRPIRVATRGKVLFSDVPVMGRATCSSTMKEVKFPSALDLAPGATDAEGPAALRVCPYTYCSLNGHVHVHAPAVPLRSFLASRRRLIKTQQSMKLKGVSAFSRGTGHQRSEEKNGGGGAKVAPLIDEEALGNYFVEVYTGPRVSSEMSCSDMSLDEIDETVRRMEFVVFDWCGADEDKDKGNNLGVCRECDGRPENRLAVCRESSSECSDADAEISGNLVDELPWVRYQGYEYDSLDEEVSEEQGDKHELGDERKVEADEQFVTKDEENISDLPYETWIVEEQDVDRVETCENGELREEGNFILNTMHQHKASIEESHLSYGEESIEDFTHKMEISAEKTGTMYSVEVCKEQEERDEDNIAVKVCQGNPSDGQGIQEEEKLFDGVCKSEIHEHEVVGRMENILADSYKEDNSVNREAKADATNVEPTSLLRVTEEGDPMDEENMLNDESEMENSEMVSCVAHKEHFSEEEVSSEDNSECEISEFSGTGYPDLEILKQPTNDGFEQDTHTVEDTFKQDGSTVNNNAFEHDIAAVNTFDGTKDAQKELEITICKFADAPEESGFTQESSQDVKSLFIDTGAEMEPEITKSKSEDSSEESGIVQEISQSDESDYVTDDAQIAPEHTTFKVGDACEKSDFSQETVHDDKSVCLVKGSQMQLEMGTSKFDDTYEESGIAHEIGKDTNSSYISDDSQRDLGITTPQTGYASEELVTVQEAESGHNYADISTAAKNELCGLANDSEESDSAEEAIQDDNTAYINDSTQKESKMIRSESERVHDESDITQERDESDYTVVVYAGPRKESQIEDTCEEPNLSSIVKIDEHNYDFSATNKHGWPQNLPAKDTDTKEFSIDDMCNVFGEMNLKGDVYLDPTESAIDPRNRLIIARRRRTPEEEEYMCGFNPRAPNFHPLELDPDAEKVDLKHQTTEDRKNAEEWMIDYALQKAVNNLGPARKKKVELLVQAFETVVPHDEDGKKSITPTRHVQACN